MMIEEFEDLRSTIPAVRLVRRTSVPRWAIDEPQPVESDANEEVPEEAVETEAVPTNEVRPILVPVRHIFPSRLEAPTEEDGLEQMPEPFKVEESTYDEQGYLIEHSQFDEGVLVQRERIAYDSEHRLVRKATEDPVNENIEKEERFYNADGRISRKVITYSDGAQMITEHIWSGTSEEQITRSDEGIEQHIKRKYDSKNRVIERLEIDPESNESHGAFQTFDNEGRVESSGIIEPDGSRWTSDKYEYDEEGREIQSLRLDKEGNTLVEITSVYDNGNLIQQVTTDEDGETFTDNVFDEGHHLIQSSTTGPGYEGDMVAHYYDNGQLAVSASRELSDRTYGIRGSVVPQASTTWWEYEFYPNA